MGRRKQCKAGKEKDLTLKKRVEENIEWIQTHCRIPEGRLVGQPVRLTIEQRSWIEQIYGSPTRRFILSMARKNAKTAFSAFLLLLHLVGPEAKPNSQLYSAAQSRDQAALLFALAAKVVRMSPTLSQYMTIRDTAKQLLCTELGTVYRALSADAATAYGLSPAFAVHDELGQVRGPRSELYEAIETGAGAQEEPLSIIISTQAPTDADLLSMLIDEAKTGADPRTKLVLYTAPEGSDPFSDDAIRAANPHFDIFMNQQEVRDQAERARRMPSSEASFRNLVLNQRINTVNPFVSSSVWESCGAEPQEDVFAANPVYAGLDLSQRSDLTALIYGACAADGTRHVRCEFFAPEMGLHERAKRDRVPYDLWARDGLLTLTPGATVDYGFVALRLCELAQRYDLVEIAFDRWRIEDLRAELSRMGRELPLVEFGQGFKDMSPALEALEGHLLNRRIAHGGNPILRMCAANAIATRDPAGNRKLDKSKPTGRIDGMVGLAMVTGRLEKASGPVGKSFWETAA